MPFYQQQLCLCCVCVLTGVGWSESTLGSKKEVQLVDALHPTGTGVIEYEVMPRPDTSARIGRFRVSALIRALFSCFSRVERGCDKHTVH
jgi:hypothetical protein